MKSLNKKVLIISLAVIFLFISIGIYLTILLGKNQQLPYSPTESYLRCNQDSDCTIVASNNCGECGCGLSLNKNYKDNYYREKQMSCIFYRGPICNTLCKKLEPRCISNTCKLFDPELNEEVRN